MIPEVLGGRLQASILCNRCNHGRGAHLVATAKADPSIRIAVEALQTRIPAFARKFLEKAEYSGRAADGSTVRLSRRGGSLKVLPSKDAQESLLLDTTEAEAALAKKLLRSGLSAEEVAGFAKRFSDLIEDVPLTIPTGETFIKRCMPPTTPELGTSLMDPRLFALIAIEFAALILGDRVLRPSFDPTREFIGGSDPSGYIEVRQALVRKPYDPFHVLLLREADGLLSVQVRLFRCIVGEVVFSTISYRGVDPIYLEDLEARAGYYALDHQHARQHQWLKAT